MGHHWSTTYKYMYQSQDNVDQKTFLPLTKKTRVEEGLRSGSSKDPGWFGTGGISQSEIGNLRTFWQTIIAGLAPEAFLNLRNGTWWEFFGKISLLGWHEWRLSIWGMVLDKDFSAKQWIVHEDCDSNWRNVPRHSCYPKSSSSLTLWCFCVLYNCDHW